MIMTFDYTRAALRRLSRRFDVVKWVVNYGVHIAMIVYLAFAMIMGMGSLLINAVLMALSIATLIYTIIYSKKELIKKQKKKAKKDLKEVKKKIHIGELVVKGVSLIVSLYGMHTATNTVSPITIIFTTIILILWILSVLVEIIVWIGKKEIEYLSAGLKYDITFGEERDAIANFIAKSKNNDKDKIILELEELVQDEREEKQEKLKSGINQIVAGVKNVFTKGA